MVCSRSLAVWLVCSLESLCQRFQISSSDSEESFFLNKLAFFLSILSIAWLNNSDSFPWQAEFWVRIIFGHICSQYRAWNHAFLSPTHRLNPPYLPWLVELSLQWWRMWVCCLEAKDSTAWNSYLHSWDKTWC